MTVNHHDGRETGDRNWCRVIREANFVDLSNRSYAVATLNTRDVRPQPFDDIISDQQGDATAPMSRHSALNVEVMPEEARNRYASLHLLPCS